MNIKIFLIFGCLMLCCWSQVSGGSDTYRAAVAEHFPEQAEDEEMRVALNLKMYKNFMAEAKAEGADIIVFPENGLLTQTIHSPVPDPADHIAPCDSPTFVTTEVVKNLSCASKENKMYSMVNLLEKRACNRDDENCPKRGYYVYNTNVGFDRQGTVIARYSKFNLYDEPLVNKTERPEMVYFDTDFNVRFGTFTCFDILFPTPALKLIEQYNVTDFLFTTYWFSELPFLTVKKNMEQKIWLRSCIAKWNVDWRNIEMLYKAYGESTLSKTHAYVWGSALRSYRDVMEDLPCYALQVQRGWAETNNVNLLASGMNYPKTATFGSGIYNGKFGDLIQIMPEIPVSKLLIADVPKIKSAEYSTEETATQKTKVFSKVINVPPPSSEIASLKPAHSPSGFSHSNIANAAEETFELLKDYIELFQSEVIQVGKRFDRKICSGDDFCCNFQVNVDSLNSESQSYVPRAVVFDGVRKFGASFRAGVQCCGVVLCKGPNISNCTSRVKKIPGMFKFKEIYIKGDFRLKDSFQMPSTLTDGDRLEPLSANKYDFKKTKKDKAVEVSLELVWPVTNLQTFGIWGRDFTRDMNSSANIVTFTPVLFAAFVFLVRAFNDFF